MHLTKLHGLGNDFLISLDAPPAEAARLARSLCDRHTGVGADGLLFGPSRSDGSVDFHLVNADGSSAEISGNGLRCLTHAVSRERGVADLDLVVHTTMGPLQASVVSLDGVHATVRAEMGAVTLGEPVGDSDVIESLVGGATWRTGDIGNPHLVVLLDDIATFDIDHLGPRLEACFPKGANVHAIELRNGNAIGLRVWERGAGVTQACGSGACVAAAALHELGMVGAEVDVVMPGGSAHVQLADSVVLTGPSTLVAEIETADG